MLDTRILACRADRHEGGRRFCASWRAIWVWSDAEGRL